MNATGKKALYPGVRGIFFILMLLYAFFLPVPESLADINGSAGIIFPELDSGAGARAAGMGGAFTAVADDASAAYWNPAGLSLIKKPEVMITFDKWYLDSFYQHFIGAFPVGTGTIGADIFYMNYGAFDIRDNTGMLLGGTLNPYNAAGTLSYGIGFGGNLSLGLGLTYAIQSIGSSSDNGFGFNLGALFKSDIFSAGISLKNMGAGGGFSLPADLRVGAAVNVFRNRSNSVLVSADAALIVNDAPQASLGVEYSLLKIFSLRAGYTFKFDDANGGILGGLSAGAGFSAGDIFFDYAVVPFGQLGLTQKAGMNFEFDPVKFNAEKEAAKAPSAKVELKDIMAEAGTLENSGKLEQAKEKYLEIIDFDINYADAWKRLGAVYVKQGKKVDAINAFERYLLIRPNDTAVRKWLDKNQ
jgi:hypothetical protein